MFLIREGALVSYLFGYMDEFIIYISKAEHVWQGKHWKLHPIGTTWPHMCAFNATIFIFPIRT